MANQPFKADSLLIGKTTNLIEKSPNGDMWFSDSFIQRVTLSELFNGTITVDPAVAVSVSVADWTTISVDGQTRYTIEIPHTWNSLSEPKVEVNIWNTDNEEITVNKVKFSNTSILLESTIKIEIQVILKRL